MERVRNQQTTRNIDKTWHIFGSVKKELQIPPKRVKGSFRIKNLHDCRRVRFGRNHLRKFYEADRLIMCLHGFGLLLHFLHNP